MEKLLTKITLFEGFTEHLTEDTYFLEGYTLRREHRLSSIIITIIKSTKFLKTTPLQLRV